MLKPVIKALGVSAVLGALSTPVAAVSWGPETQVGVFYPGQTSLEWIYSKRYHDGAARYKKRKKDCQACHEGDEPSYGPNIVGGGDTEAAPLGGRHGHVVVKAQAAVEGGNLHVRLEWPKASGPAAEKQDADFDTKITMMLDNASIEEFTAGGCWAACHIDAKGMPADGDKKKYITESRSKMNKKTGGGENYKSDGDIQALIDANTYLEYWQARLNPGQPAKAVHGHILKERWENPAPTLTATATEAGAGWVVEFSRPLAGDANSKPLEDGKTYMVGFALHDQNAAGRYHLVSFQYKLNLNGAGTTIEVSEKKE